MSAGRQAAPGYLFRMIALTALLARKNTVKQEARLLDLAEALQGFLEYEKAMQAAGLTNGRIEFSESDGPDELYALEVRVLKPTRGMDAEKTREAFFAAVPKREFADCITQSGSGEFFTVEINFATFRDEWIKPLQNQLVEAGVVIDL